MCTIFGRGELAGCKSPFGFLASTSDDPYGVRTHVIAKSPLHAYRFIGTRIKSLKNTVPWEGMLTRALNEKGLAFTYSYVPCHEEKGEPRDRLEFSEGLITRCSSVAEAANYLGSGVPEGCTGNWMLLDASGELAVVEASCSSSEVLMQGDLVRTNSWQLLSTPEKTNVAKTGPDPILTASSDSRLRRATSLLGLESTVDEVMNLVRDHEGMSYDEPEYGLSICNHGKSMGTVSAEIVVPRQNALYYNFGRPCGACDRLASWGRFHKFVLSEVRDGILTSVEGRILGTTAIASADLT